MPLTMTIVHGPPGVRPECRQTDGDAVTIGRGTGNDWVLPDPERLLSKRHCVVARGGDTWEVTDTSSNGTFVNHELERLGAAGPRVLRDGDRLRLGTYVIEVALQREAAAPEAPPDEAPSWPDDGRLTGEPFPKLEDDPLSVLLPGDDLLSSADQLARHDGMDPGPAMADDVPALHGSYEAPRATFDVLPDDWDEPDEPASAPAAEPLREVTVPAAPVAPSAREDGVTALLSGAGVSGSPEVDPAQLLTEVGEAFRAVVVGLRRMMIARATIKGEFRIDRTMLRASGNNPLKFAADDGDALAALLRLGRRGDVTPKDAITDALDDLRVHELATAAAMQRAVQDLLAELAPTRAQQEAEARVTDRLPGRREARAWRAYQSLHRRTLRSLNDGPDSVFGRSFARAYEQAVGELAGQGEDEAISIPGARRRS